MKEIKILEEQLRNKSNDISILITELEILEKRMERRLKHKEEIIEKQREIILRLTEEKNDKEKQIAQDLFNYHDLHEQFSLAEKALAEISEICYKPEIEKGLIYKMAIDALEEIKNFSIKEGFCDE